MDTLKSEYKRYKYRHYITYQQKKGSNSTSANIDTNHPQSQSDEECIIQSPSIGKFFTFTFLLLPFLLTNQFHKNHTK